MKNVTHKSIPAILLPQIDTEQILNCLMDESTDNTPFSI